MDDHAQLTAPTRQAPDPRQRPPHGRHHIDMGPDGTKVHHLAARFLPDGERFQQLARMVGQL